MKTGPLTITRNFFIATLILFSTISLFLIPQISLLAQTATGKLSVLNNSLSQDYPLANLTVRTLMYICTASGNPLAESTPLLSGQSFSSSVPIQTYNIRTYNEVVGIGQSGASTFISADPYYYDLICAGSIPSSVVATVNTISSSVDTLVQITGTTQVNLINGDVPGVEIPVYQALSPVGGISTGVRIRTVDMRIINEGQVAVNTTPLATVCIDDQLSIASDTIMGDYQLTAGNYVIKKLTPNSGVEVFDCQDLTTAPVTVVNGTIRSLLYALVDDQSGFFGIQQFQQTSPTQSATVMDQAQITPQSPNPGMLLDSQSPLQSSVLNSIFAQPSSKTSHAAQADLIRSGGESTRVLSFTIIAFAFLGLIGVFDSWVGEQKDLDYNIE